MHSYIISQKLQAMFEILLLFCTSIFKYLVNRKKISLHAFLNIKCGKPVLFAKSLLSWVLVNKIQGGEDF